MSPKAAILRPLPVLEITLSPNPARDFVKVNLNSARKDAAVTLFDITGKKLQLIKAEGRDVLIDLRGLESGIYFLQILDDETLHSKKFIVQH